MLEWAKWSLTLGGLYYGEKFRKVNIWRAAWEACSATWPTAVLLTTFRHGPRRKHIYQKSYYSISASSRDGSDTAEAVALTVVVVSLLISGWCPGTGIYHKLLQNRRCMNEHGKVFAYSFRPTWCLWVNFLPGVMQQIQRKLVLCLHSVT
jgi:hypothetical protein